MREVDTLTFGCLFSESNKRDEIVEKIKNKTDKKKDRDGEICYVGKVGGYTFYFKEKYYFIAITLQNKVVENKTETEIRKNTTTVICNYFDLIKTDIEIENLNRIDYKTDYKLKNERELKIIQEILDIAVDKILKKNYKEISTDKGFYVAKYKSKNSGYIEIVFYDKGSAMKKMYEKGKITFEEMKKYEDVFRTELRIKNKRLNYEKNKNGISKDINNYYDIAVKKAYFEYYIVKKILGKEKFYRLDVAIKKVKTQQSIKDSMKEKLCKLLKDINKKGYTSTRESYRNICTFNAHTKRIRELGINILTFSKDVGQEVESIENFAITNNT